LSVSDKDIVRVFAFFLVIFKLNILTIEEILGRQKNSKKILKKKNVQIIKRKYIMININTHETSTMAGLSSAI
jgi:hypothetical protein